MQILKPGRHYRVSLRRCNELLDRYDVGGPAAIAAELKALKIDVRYLRAVARRIRRPLPTAYHNLRKVSENTRHQLLQIYLHMGAKESYGACVEAGVSQHYAERLASEMGLYIRAKTKPDKVSVSNYVNHDDPRWERARRIGKVVV